MKNILATLCSKPMVTKAIDREPNGYYLAYDIFGAYSQPYGKADQPVASYASEKRCHRVHAAFGLGHSCCPSCPGHGVEEPALVGKEEG